MWQLSQHQSIMNCQDQLFIKMSDCLRTINKIFQDHRTPFRQLLIQPVFALPENSQIKLNSIQIDLASTELPHREYGRIVKFSDGTTGPQQCSICLESWGDWVQLLLNCQHSYHIGCIRGGFETDISHAEGGISCPLCRL